MVKGLFHPSLRLGTESPVRVVKKSTKPPGFDQITKPPAWFM